MTGPKKALCADESNPWKTNETRQIYENPWLRIREDAVIQPDGKPGIYGVVHFRNKAVGVLPIDDDGCTYLIGQYRYPLGIYSWEIPEGGCPEGEETLLAAQRELWKKPVSQRKLMNCFAHRTYRIRQRTKRLFFISPED